MLKKTAFWVFVLWATYSPAWADTRVTFPESWDIGQAFVVSLASNQLFTGPSVTWMDRVISLDVEAVKGGYVSYALLGSFVKSVTSGDYPLVFDFIQEGQPFRVKCTVHLRSRKYPEEYLTVQSKMVTPPKNELKRIQKEAKLTGAALKTMSVERRWKTPAQRPVPGIVTSSYGFRRVYNKIPKGHHAGTDFRAATGTPIKAPFAGVVVLTGDHYYAGKSVYVDSGNGVISLFFHLNEIAVKKGDQIQKGQVIGKAGASGRVTGPHLHYGLHLAGQYVDSTALFENTVTGMLKQMRTEVIRN